MIKGVFVGNNPYIQTTLIWNGAIKSEWFILDTGFTGDLQMPHSWGKELGMKISSIVPFKIANGTTINVPHGTAMASMEGDTNFVQIGFSDGSPLMGIDFFRKFGYKVIVDCKHKTVEIQKVS